MARLFLGGYTSESGGDATGIGVLHAGAPDEVLAGGALAYTRDAVATGGSPSWLAWHPTLDVVYAALEGDGAVRAFRRTGEESFAPLGAAVPAGELTCHVAVAPDGSSLVASCWGDGRVVRMGLDAAGRPSSPVPGAPAADPYGGADGADGPASAGPQTAAGIDLAAAARALREAAGAEYAHLVPDHDVPGALEEGSPAAETQRVSRAHEALFLGRGAVATTDMGLDLVRFWHADGTGLRLAQEVVLPRGAGPRHMVRHPSGHLYVVTELSHEVFVLAPDAAGSWRIVGGTPLGPGVDARDTAAELALSRDAAFLYAGVRGTDTIATLRVRGGGDAVEPVALVEAGVHWPRHHVVLRDTLLVAGQLGGEIASLALDERTGVPGRVRHRTPAPTPSCLLPDRG